MLPRTKTVSQALYELLTLGRQWRNSSVRRVHDKRCLTVRLLPFLPIRRRIDADAALRECLIVRLLLLLRLPFSLSKFFVGQESTRAEIRGPLHRNICNG